MFHLSRAHDWEPYEALARAKDDTVANRIPAGFHCCVAYAARNDLHFKSLRWGRKLVPQSMQVQL